MTPAEIDNALEELSNRMERVRSLYEQYFMGLERLEPTIPRKDLDRRMEALRKTRFQNTAKRFKFQTLVQRYTSLQQYWYRTCRDIENGTYRKHLQKAKRRFGEDQPKTAEDQQERAPSAASAKERAEEDLAALLDEDIDLGAEFENALRAFSSDPAVKGNAPAGAGRGTLLGSLQQKDSGGKSLPSPKLSLGPLALKPSIKPSVQPGIREASPGALKSLSRSTSTAPKPLGPAPKPLASSPKPTGSSPLAAPTPKPLASSPKPLASSPKPTGSSPLAASSPKPLASSPKPLGSAPLAGQTPKRPPAAPPKPLTSSPKPLATAPQTAEKKSSTSGLTEERIRAIHSQYQTAREKTQAAAVSYEKLARNLRETEQQLRAKHKGRDVDFDVAIKDGKAILRPKLK